MFSVKQNKNP